jgi:predicted nucleic acid-binding protein
VTFVLDASIALAFCFPDEATPFTESVLDALQKTRAVAPGLWVYEVVNAFVVGERRNRISASKGRELMTFLASLPIDIHPEPAFGAGAQAIHALAKEFDLSAYDAAYLELCKRLGVPLATLDGEGRRVGLKQAAALAKVRLFAAP